MILKITFPSKTPKKQMQVENLSFMCHKTEVQLSAKRAKVSNLHCDVFMDWKAL